MANFTELEILNALKGFQWSQAPGQTMTVTYSFGDNAIISSYWESWLPGLNGITPNSFAPLSGNNTSGQQKAFNDVVMLWKNVANIDLIQPLNSGVGDILASSLDEV
jgi:hypothetical protein